MSAPPLTLERYAIVSAYVAHFASRHADRPDGSGRAPMEKVLERLGVARADYGDAKTHWNRIVHAELEEGETTHSLAMADPFQSTQARLREAKPRVEDLQPLDPAAARPSAPPPAPPTVEDEPTTQASSVPPPAVVAPAAAPDAAPMAQPSFLQPNAAVRPAPSFLAARPAQVLGGMVVGAAPAPPAPAPPERVVPSPSAVPVPVSDAATPSKRSAITTDEIPAVSRSGAQARSVSPLPFVPSAPAPAPQRSKEREAMVPVGMRGFKSLTGTQGPIEVPRGPAMPFASADARATHALPLERYASLTAALASGEARADVLARHQLSEERWRELVSAWGERFEREPELMTQFRDALAQIRGEQRR